MARDGGMYKKASTSDADRLKRGFDAEELARRYVRKMYKDVVTTRFSNDEEDRAHIDLFVVLSNGYEITVDVKAIKKPAPWLPESDKYHTLELRNVRNNPGSTLGSAWGHMFQVNEGFITVSNIKLQNLSAKLMVENGLDINKRRCFPRDADPEDVAGKMILQSYRDDRNDAMILVKKEWLLELQENPFTLEFFKEFA